jgi:hypothetical protein
MTGTTDCGQVPAQWAAVGKHASSLCASPPLRSDHVKQGRMRRGAERRIREWEQEGHFAC